ncbi:MAG TPA: outer membrane protein assembly factor BamC [Burkholderiaceae bacterium]|nr:outer membrane protein assembly factor BamC [Burkholderiaceae bacterium]
MTRSLSAPTKGLACGLVLVSLTACSSIEGMIGTDKVDYRTGAKQTSGLDVPPDLTQLNQERRNTGGVVTASEMANQKTAPRASAAATAGNVALNAVGDVKLERVNGQRVLRSSLTPEQLWPQVRGFWMGMGFEIASEQAEIGVMETNWAENRAKLPLDFIRRTIGQALDNLYSTGERDKYRTRVERVNGGTEITIYHRGMQEVYTGQQRDQTVWQPRPADASLEGEMLSRLMLKLGGREVDAKEALQANAGSASTTKLAVEPAARNLADVPTSLSVNEDFDRAWRRVGQSLDRHGFTVEDRDRKLGLFFLRYADPNMVGKEEPNFFSRFFGFGKTVTANRYRVLVKSDGSKSVVSITDSQGVQQTDDNAKRILSLLLEDLR